MAGQNIPFHERVAQLEARGKGTSGKSVLTQKPEGLFTPTLAKPKRQVPWRALVLAVVCLVGLKGFLFAQFGEDRLAERLAEMAQSQPAAHVLAFVLRPDPVSDWAAAQIAPLLPNPYVAES